MFLRAVQMDNTVGFFYSVKLFGLESVLMTRLSHLMVGEASAAVRERGKSWCLVGSFIDAVLWRLREVVSSPPTIFRPIWSTAHDRHPSITTRQLL